MGSAQTKHERPRAPQETVWYFFADNDGIVTHASQPLLTHLKYAIGDVVGHHFADILMDGLMKHAHKKLFLANYDKRSGRNRMEQRTYLFSGPHTRIRHHVLDGAGRRVAVFVSMEDQRGIHARGYEMGRRWKCTLTPMLNLRCAAMPSKYIPPNMDADLVTSENVGVIVIDLHKASSLLQKQGVHAYASLQRSIYERVQNIVRYTKPFVVLHEVHGDRIVLLVNQSWWYRIHLEDVVTTTTCIALLLGQQLHDACASFGPDVFVRIGVAFGSLMGTVAGKRFRVYGTPLTMATLLQQQCPTQCVYVQRSDNDAFAQKHRISSMDVQLDGFKDSVSVASYYLPTIVPSKEVACALLTKYLCLVKQCVSPHPPSPTELRKKTISTSNNK